MNSAQAVAGEVRAQLARARVSGRQAAMRIGWTAPYLSRRLIGEIPFDVEDLQAIADLLDIPITAFFERPAVAAEVQQSGHLVRKSAFPVRVALVSAA